MTSPNPTSMAQADIVKSHLVTPEEYGIVPRLSAKLKLSPLDQNMPRMYGSRWILCFPLPAGVDEKHVFENLKKALAYTISAMPWIAGEIGLEEGQNKESNIVQIVEGQGGYHILDTWASNTGIEGDLGPFREYDPIVNDRTPLRRGLPDANIAEFPLMKEYGTAKASSGLAPPTYKLPPMVSKVFFVSRPKLEDLKTEARAFSINDALCAFFWHHMTLARASSSLSPFRSIDNKNVPTSAALFANAQDFQFAVKAFLGPDVTMTSWADLKIRDRDWGSLGTPEGFKIPYEGADGNITIYPRLQNGGLEVMVCLENLVSVQETSELKY
ncbi:hypothetical protein M7I_0468 [Glarea lozoyensis 74030]|uniref:Trichothecene 3-O-acetyltransferase n=1 Tax=Glarea lozoyensis (strain ATCC 74030 / MF5533) TaxID=1104152 RepID=H0EDL3_GLAL7|nr:hypothetical protein M7I_0468 [Glarea lozoyensis 74030]